jgi:polyferredoxin/Flp pilus assembly protein TadD
MISESLNPLIPSFKKNPQSNPLQRIFSRRALRGWRWFSLLAIHLLFAVHLWHWKRHGVTLAPLEFSETLHTLHAGIITLGFLFTITALLGTLMFGRFFCGWGCHILALQDACAWLLARLSIRPKPLRSRVMAKIPLGILLYLYVWPQIARLLSGESHPGFRIQGLESGWGSFATSDLFRAMPGPGMAVLTLLVCGFATVYFLGSRGFCYSVCPYGAFFGWAERFSPARLVLSGGCENCGLCTVNCKSGVKVIQELRQFGTVTDSNCLKSMDCVAGCPSQAIKVTFSLSSSSRSKASAPSRARRYDFTWGEEVAFLVIFLTVFLTSRGLYGIGVLFAASLAAIAGAVAITARRRASRGHLSGVSKVVLTLAVALCAHSAYVQARQLLGNRAFKKQASPLECIRHLEEARRWAFVRDPEWDRNLALAYSAHGDETRAKSRFTAYLERNPRDASIRLAYGNLLVAAGNPEAGLVQFTAAAVQGGSAEGTVKAAANSAAAQVLAAQGNFASALLHLETALSEAPGEVSHYCNIAMLRIRMGERREAREILARAQARLGDVECLRGLAPLAVDSMP